MHLGKTLSVSEQKAARGSAWFASESLVCRYVRSWYFSGHGSGPPVLILGVVHAPPGTLHPLAPLSLHLAISLDGELAETK